MNYKSYKMTKAVLISIIILSFFSLKPSVAGDLRIMNIMEGQELNGHVLVELSSSDLSNYKKVSYCLDGKLIINVYDAPFTVEWDTRDFDNGEYELSVRAVHSMGRVHIDARNIIINNPEQAYKFIIENPRRIVSKEHNNYRTGYIDCPHTVLKKNEKELYFFHHQGLMMHQRENQGTTYISSGTLEEPLKIIESGRYVPEVWDRGEHETQGIWLMGVYKIGENELLGFTHNESCFDPDEPCTGDTKDFSIGIGYSNDNGKNWTYCGDIIRTPQYGKYGKSNIKGVPYLIKDEYFYIYYWEFPAENKWYPAVARAKIGDVIRSARQGENVIWKKYNNGKWDQDGMTGLGSDVMQNLDRRFNMHCKISYVPSIEKYLMITYENGKENVFLLISDDGLNWEITDRIMDHNTDKPASYPFIGDFHTDDCHEIDDDFYIYWAKDYRELWGARVVIVRDLVDYQSSEDTQKINLLPGEKIWSGVIVEGHKMPFEDGYEFDFYNNRGNQIQPLLLSNKGLYVWSEEPYKFKIDGSELVLTNYSGVIETGRPGESLKEAYKYAAEKFFPPSGELPDELLFSAPQYNTWIELTYNQNQEDILEYARAIIDKGFPPGVFMIDDTWQEDYGLWDFHPGRFPNPKKMMDELHEMGFKVMLWICPFVSADQALVIREIMEGKGLLLQKENESMTWEEATDPAIVEWWNGYSALLDFTNPAGVEWFNGVLEKLVNDYGVDGFKFDAGDTRFYEGNVLSFKEATPNEHCELFAGFGLDYPLNEYRACWKMAGKPIAQRLRDKGHNWDDLQKLIPHMLTESLAGYTFACPDMIGGGEFRSFLDLDTYDEELVVRSAQCHALMPMMQFSVAPWRVLNAENLAAVKKSVELRNEYTPLIKKLAHNSAKTSEPIVSSLEYHFPNQGYENIHDQFMLGDKIMVAPMVKKGYNRVVTFPKGKWTGDNGEKYKGGKTYTIDVPIDRVPYFKKIK